ncbi:MAG TPA: hypothetical protein VFB23_09970 [Candidatus Acidoferrales bacterium]|jgi:hypothetical protein|nr:hypothetical protein [Candidatus Acidoferrales bacterium]
MMNEDQRANAACPCLDAETHFCGFEKKAIGIDEQYGEVAVWTCKNCGRKWLHYFVEYEYLTGAGRMFTGIISPAVLAGITAGNAVDAFEAMDWYFRGGSAFGDTLLRTTGSLKPWLIPFPGR